MHILRVSKSVRTPAMDDVDYSVVTIRASSFDGLMDPLLGFELFRMRARTFRPRPFAGISILTYLFAGSAACHLLDTTGTDCLLQPGGLAWAQAGKGLVRAAFPEKTGTVSSGIQLLLNMPTERKQSGPKVAVYDAAPGNADRGVHTRMVMDSVYFNFMHIRIERSESTTYQLPAGWNVTIHLLEGAVRIQTSAGGTELRAGTSVALGQSSTAERLVVEAHERSEVLLFSGLPIGEPAFGSETMSMSSAEELEKVLADYEEGKIGFITLTAGKWQIIPPTK